MIPKLWYFLTHFFHDAAYFDSIWDRWVAKVRGAVMMFGAAIAIPGTGLSERIEAIVSPKWRPFVGLGLMGLSLMMRAGDKTPANVRALANSITPPEVTPVPPRGVVAWWVLPVVVLISALSLALAFTAHHRKLTTALAAAESARAKLADQVVADATTKHDLQIKVESLLADNTDLAKKYTEARASVAGLTATGVAKLSTGSIQVSGTPLPRAVATSAPLNSDPAPVPAGHSGEGTPAERALVWDQSPFVPGCMLQEADKLDVRVDLIEMKAQQGTVLVVGTAEVWRVDPEARLSRGAFTSALSDVGTLAPSPEPRWGAGPALSCGLRGCAPGVVLALPPFRLPILPVRVDPILVAATGPIEPSILLALPGRF